MKNSELARNIAAKICADAYSPNTYSTESIFDEEIAAAIIDKELAFLFSVLQRARTLMPLGTKIRADWLSDATDAMAPLRSEEKRDV